METRSSSDETTAIEDCMVKVVEGSKKIDFSKIHDKKRVRNSSGLPPVIELKTWKWMQFTAIQTLL